METQKLSPKKRQNGARENAKSAAVFLTSGVGGAALGGSVADAMTHELIKEGQKEQHVNNVADPSGQPKEPLAETMPTVDVAQDTARPATNAENETIDITEEMVSLDNNDLADDIETVENLHETGDSAIEEIESLSDENVEIEELGEVYNLDDESLAVTIESEDNNLLLVDIDNDEVLEVTTSPDDETTSPGTEGVDFVDSEIQSNSSDPHYWAETHSEEPSIYDVETT